MKNEDCIWIGQFNFIETDVKYIIHGADTDIFFFWKIADMDAGKPRTRVSAELWNQLACINYTVYTVKWTQIIKGRKLFIGNFIATFKLYKN